MRLNPEDIAMLALAGSTAVVLVAFAIMIVLLAI